MEKENYFVAKNVMNNIKKQFEVEVYNGCSIYAVEHLGEKDICLGGSQVIISQISKTVERE